MECGVPAWLYRLILVTGRDSRFPIPIWDNLLTDTCNNGSTSNTRSRSNPRWLSLYQMAWIVGYHQDVTRNNGKQIEKRKDPIQHQQATMLIKCAWELFETVWKCRNSILHSNENKLATHNEKSLNNDLLDFKRHNVTYLRRCDRFIIDRYAKDDIIKWIIPRKRATLALLVDLRKIYRNELRLEGTGYRDIRDFIIRTARPAPRALEPCYVAGSSDSGTIYGTESSLSDSTEESETYRPPRDCHV